MKSRQRSWHDWVLLLLAAICGTFLGAGLIQIFLRHVGHDQSWCLYAADLMLHGVPLDGTQLVEVNPPFILWFSEVPVLLGNLLHVGILNGFRVFFDLLEVVSLGCTAYLIHRFFRASRTAFWLFCLTLIIATLWLISEDSLGQREHMLVLFLVPFLVVAAARTAREQVGATVAVLAGFSGGLAICLKPQHLLAVVAVELLVLVTWKSLRALLQPEVLTLSAVLVLYAISVQLFGRAYLSNVAPKLLLTYSSMNVPYGVVIRSTTHVALGILLGWAILFAFRGVRSPYSPLAKVFGVASGGSLMAYILQAKAWGYQQIPAGMLAVMFLGTVLIGIIDGWLPEENRSPINTRSRPVFTCALIFVLLSGALDLRFGHRKGYYELKKRELAEIYAHYPEGAAVAYFATEPWEMPLVIEQHKVLGQRFNYFWMMPAIIKAQDPENTASTKLTAQQVGDLTAFQRDAMTEDLQRWKPAVVVIDECGPNLCPELHREHFETVLGWLKADPIFHDEWTHYYIAGRMNDLEIFQRMP